MQFDATKSWEFMWCFDLSRDIKMVVTFLKMGLAGVCDAGEWSYGSRTDEREEKEGGSVR